MTDSDFSQKEILNQLMKEMRELRNDLANHRLLLNQQATESANRDEKIVELRTEIKEIKTELHEMISNFEFFKFKVTLIAGVIATGASIVGNKLLSYFFGI